MRKLGSSDVRSDSAFVCLLQRLHVFCPTTAWEPASEINPHTLSVNVRVGVTLPVSFSGHLSICPSFCLCDWLLVSSTYLRTLRPDACSFSISYCQSGWSHVQIYRYLNENPTLMPLSVCPCVSLFPKAEWIYKWRIQAKIVTKTCSFCYALLSVVSANCSDLIVRE